MSQRASARVAVPAAILLVLVALGLAYFLIPRNGQKGPGDQPGDEPSFREEAEKAGITFKMLFLPGEQGVNFKTNLYDHGSGLAVGDFDGDGHDDIYFVNQLGPNVLYRNNKDGTFTDVTAKAGVGLGDRICVAAAWGDYDNDGKQDLFVTSTRGGNVLFHNNGDGTFTDVTNKAGLTHVGHSQTAVFFDYDNDGYLDLFVTNTGKWTLADKEPGGRYFPGVGTLLELAACPREYNILYHNNGNGTFTDVTTKARLAGKGWSSDVAVFDYNDDGYLDLLVTNMFGASQLYRNNKDSTFTDVTKEVLRRTSWGATGAKAFDFNNDGRLDLFIVDMHSDMWMQPPWPPRESEYDLTKKYSHVAGGVYPKRGGKEIEELFLSAFKIRYEDVLFGNTFFKNLGGGECMEISDQANLETFWPWGAVPGDFDNDGFEDVFIPAGMGFPYDYWPNSLMMNKGDETFTDRAKALGIDPPPGGAYYKEKIAKRPSARSSRAAATVYHEGRLDLAVNNFNGRAYYFRNHFPKKNYIAFQPNELKGN
ncbi:MAG: VCBS repeat-containing protein [Planctomycetes bacterium]|nr:VCBS repeat-containing protein [Planctomycetota bacterium]